MHAIAKMKSDTKQRMKLECELALSASSCTACTDLATIY